MADEIKPGDVVVLKSGGPKMTVSSYDSDHLGNEIRSRVICEWFEGTKPKYGEYEVVALKIAPDDPRASFGTAKPGPGSVFGR